MRGKQRETKTQRQFRIENSLWERLRVASETGTERTGEATISGLIRRFCIEGLERLARREGSGR